MKNVFGVIVVLVVVGIVGCSGGGSASGYAGFQERLQAGADCAELFEIRNSVDPSSPDVPRMNSALREIGCFSSSSTRTR